MRPATSHVEPGLIDTLAVLHGRLDGALALVSGRRLMQLDALFAPLQLPAVGLHGLERRDDGHLDSHQRAPALDAVLAAARALAAKYPGALVEDKGTAIALHWRGAPAAEEPLHEFATSALIELPGYHLQPGNRVIELRPDGAHKGAAVLSLLASPPFQGRRRCSSATTSLTSTGSRPCQLPRRLRRAGRPASAQRGALWRCTIRWRCGPGWTTPSPSLDTKGDGMIHAANPQSSLDLGLIGNGSIAALVDAHARIVWGCVPAFDGDPVFCALLSPRLHEGGDYAIELDDMASSEQEYLPNTAVLRTLLRDATWRCRRDHRFRAPLAPARTLLSAGHAVAPGAPAFGPAPHPHRAASALPNTALRSRRPPGAATTSDSWSLASLCA